MVRSVEMLYEEMSEIISDYLKKGYIICNDNSSSSGIESKCILLDIKKRIKVVVCIVRKYSSYTDELYKKHKYHGDIYRVCVMRDKIKNVESELKHDLTTWISDMPIIYEKDYYELSASWSRHKGYTTDLNDVIEFCCKHNERETKDTYMSEVYKEAYKDIDRLRIALNRVKREPRTKMVHLENINWVKKDGHRYIVSYTTNNGTNKFVYIK